MRQEGRKINHVSSILSLDLIIFFWSYLIQVTRLQRTCSKCILIHVTKGTETDPSNGSKLVNYENDDHSKSRDVHSWHSVKIFIVKNNETIRARIIGIHSFPSPRLRSHNKSSRSAKWTRSRTLVHLIAIPKSSRINGARVNGVRCTS